MVLEKFCECGKMNVVEKAAGCVVRRFWTQIEIRSLMGENYLCWRRRICIGLFSLRPLRIIFSGYAEALKAF